MSGKNINRPSVPTSNGTIYEELFDEKTNTQKSHDTVPLRNLTNMYEKN